VINNHDTQTKGLWVDSSPSGWASWSGQTLVNAFNTAQTAVVQADGRVYLSAPPRGYAVYVKQSEVVAYSDPGARTKTTISDAVGYGEPEGDFEPEFHIYSNPVKDKLNVLISTPRIEDAQLEFTNLTGKQMGSQMVKTNRSTEMDLSTYPNGMYILRASIGRYFRTHKIIKE
jgi:alpha-amylase